MKFLKNIGILFSVVLLNQSIDASSMIYQKNIAHNSPQAAQRLVEESFITPEMQWSVLSFLGKQEMVINPTTGQVQGFPTVDAVLKQINQQLQQPIYSAQKESMKNAAHALLEATDIALFVTSIEAVYQKQNQLASNQITAQLNAQKQALNQIANTINSMQTIDQAPSSSYFSWIPYFGQGSSQQVTPISTQQVQFNPSNQMVAIPASLMPTIIKVNDYKQISDSVQAANLLFKECFIAQQHHLKDAQRLQSLNINLQSPVSAQNYIFTNFPNLYNYYSGSYPICQIAEQMVASQAPRTTLQAPLTAYHHQAHQLLLHIRQAIQTALYIANKNSSYNAGSMLSSSITSWLDGIVNQLMKYDSHLAQLCKNPLYGATQTDIDLEPSWSTNAKIAGGLVVVAGVVAATVVLNPLGAGTALTQAASTAYSTAAGGAGYVKGAVYSAIPSAVSQYFVGDPVQGPMNENGDPVVATSAPAEPLTWGQRGAQLVDAAGKASILAGVTQMAIPALQQAEQQGYLEKGTYQAMTGGYGNQIYDQARNIGIIAGAVSSTSGVIDVYKNWGNEGYFWSSLKGLQSLVGFTGSVTHAYRTVVNLLAGLIAIKQQNDQAVRAGQPEQKISAQQIYQYLTNIVQQAPAKNLEPMALLIESIQVLAQNSIGDPQTILIILQQMQQDNQQNNPDFANKIGQFIQKLVQDINQQA